MRADKHNPGPVGGLECDRDPQRATQVLHAYMVDWNGAAQAISEGGATATGEVIQERIEVQLVSSGECCDLLLCARCGCYLCRHASASPSVIVGLRQGTKNHTFASAHLGETVLEIVPLDEGLIAQTPA